MFHDGFMSGGMWLTWIFWIAVAGLIVYLILKYTDQKRTINGYNSETPLEILKKRYAKGEISKDEYENMMKDIQ